MDFRYVSRIVFTWCCEWGVSDTYRAPVTAWESDSREFLHKVINMQDEMVSSGEHYPDAIGYRF